MTFACAQCGETFHRAARGPTPKYCGERCRAAAHHARQTVRGYRHPPRATLNVDPAVAARLSEWCRGNGRQVRKVTAQAIVEYLDRQPPHP